MSRFLTGAFAFLAMAAIAIGATDNRHAGWDAFLPGINPDMLSGGLYAALSEVIAPQPRVERAVEFPGGLALPVFLDARIGANVPTGTDPPELPIDARQQAEPHVARSIIDPDFLVATFQEGRFASNGGARNCGYAVTRDGGLTWKRALIPGLTTISGGPYFRATDPVAGIDRAGNIYLNNLVSLDNAFGLGAVVINKSTDGGITFGAPVTIFQPANNLTFPDKNWMAVNDYAGPFSTNRVLVSWTNFARNAQGQTTGNNIVTSVSNNGGATWTPPANVTPIGSSKQGSQPMFFADGTAGMAYVTFVDPNNVINFRIQYQHSADGGLTWPGPERNVATLTGWDDPVLRDGIFLISAINARGTGDIVIAVTARIAGQPKIVFFKSTNRGATWTGPIVASDNGDNVSVVNPAIAVSADGQQVSIIYYEKAQLPDTLNYVNIKAVHSFDGGATWNPSIRVTDVTTDVRLGQNTDRGFMLGDYQGLAMPTGPDAPPVALWIDTRTGEADPFSARVVPATNPDYSAWRRAQLSSANLGNPSLSAADADLDSDGLPNGLEYALGTNPNRPDFATPFGYFRGPGPLGTELTLSYPKRVNLPDVQFGWDRSTGSTPWTPVVPRTESSESIRANTGLLVANTHPLSGAPDERFRLRATVGGTPAPAGRFFGPLNLSRLINVSTRGFAGDGERILIGGFVLRGSSFKEVLVRGAGPSLAQFGVGGVLADPQLEIFRPEGTTPVFANNDWETPAGAVITEITTQVGAFPFAPGSKDAALKASTVTGGFTAQVKGTSGQTGVALVEIYDASKGNTGGRLINLSTRGFVGTDANILIAGFVIEGLDPKLVLVRAAGPALVPFGVAGPLTDPRLEVFRSGSTTPIAKGDDWSDAINAPALVAASQLTGAFPFQNGSRDAAILLHLPPGGYTVHVTGSGGLTGVALVEVYEVN